MPIVCRLLAASVLPFLLLAAASAAAAHVHTGGSPPDPSGKDAAGLACLPRLGRQSRRLLTARLKQVWGKAALESWDLLPGLWTRPVAHLRRHRHRCLFPRRLRRRCGYAGVRVGEAAHPGPPASDAPGPSARARSPPAADGDGRPGRRQRVAQASEAVRCFCPVPGCLLGDPQRASGWASHQSMRHHLDEHCSGALCGAVPAEYLRTHNLNVCGECGLLVAARYNGAHPRCRAAARARPPPELSSAPTRPCPTLTRLPKHPLPLYNMS